MTTEYKVIRMYFQSKYTKTEIAMFLNISIILVNSIILVEEDEIQKQKLLSAHDLKIPKKMKASMPVAS